MADTRTDFVPNQLYGAFLLFHMSLSIGLSEALCESVGSLVKTHSDPRLNQHPGRVIERVSSAVGGVSGLPTHAEDQLMLRTWAEMFGGRKGGPLNFNYKHPNTRREKFPLGAGSKTLHRLHVKLRAWARRVTQPQCTRISLPTICGSTVAPCAASTGQ